MNKSVVDPAKRAREQRDREGYATLPQDERDLNAWEREAVWPDE